ncbi:YciI family protein [Pseudactinotalea suaedae]|uniref:YciI family protein n=1 Tax=Pseudactinotalea suaedae TaxID=1524924 RepID=UPI0019D6A003|nr:YciI family protein [Pseudactinotalea suaedae]
MTNEEWRFAMAQYMVLIPDDYDAWEAMTPQQRNEVYAEHEVFAARLARGGHRVTGGAELTLPRTARTVRSGPDGITVTDGPYTEAVEQLSGYYLIETDDLPDLEQACGILAHHVPIEIRQLGRAVEDDVMVVAAEART